MAGPGRAGERYRLHTLSAIFTGVGLVLLGRAVNLQVVNHDAYAALARESHLQSTSLPAHRGSILDAKGNPLAITIRFDNLYAVGTEIKDPDALALQLAPLLEMAPLEIRAKIDPADNRPALIKERLPSALSLQIDALREDGKIKGVYLKQENYREYPEGSIAAQVLGFVGRDHTGLTGVEYSYEDELAGTPGLLQSERDSTGLPIAIDQRVLTEPIHGADVVLTIDRAIQRIAEQALAEAVTANKASGGLVLIMEPATGSILAMASNPTYTLSDVLEHRPEQEVLYKPVQVTNQYEPGSVMKPITMAAGIEERVVTPQSTMMDNGEILVGGHTLKNWDGHANGLINMTQVLIFSSNVGAQWVAGLLGPERFYRYVDAFGFGKRTGVHLPGEATGTVRPYNEPGWARVDLATNSYGQGIAVTPLQMLTAISTLANGGTLMQPRIVSELRRGGEVEPRPPVAVRQVVSPTTAQLLTDMMTEVLEQPALQPHRVAGYRFAGKTGTSDTPTNLGYDTHKTYASVVAYGPLPHPRYSILIRLDAPEAIFGGIVAAPVLKRLNQELVAYFGLPPNQPGTGMPPRP